jgi:1,2-phenylacetyl-CoA epoxidase catalytic subunit
MAAPVLGSQAEARQWLADTWAALRLGALAEASDAAAGRNAMAA